MENNTERYNFVESVGLIPLYKWEVMSKAEKTRQFIIEKTAPVFNKKGYAGTSLSDLTEATGLTKGSIYGNFEGKDEVALEAFDYNSKKVNAIITTEMAQQQTYRDKMLVYVRVYEHFLKYPFPPGGCPILNTATEADDTHPALKEKACAAFIHWKTNIIRIVEEGMRAGEFKPGQNAEQIALTIIATIEGAIMIAKLSGNLHYKNTILKSVEALINAL